MESLTFGSECLDFRIALELITSVQYKLGMFGLPIDVPANAFCDNEDVYRNDMFSES